MEEDALWVNIQFRAVNKLKNSFICIFFGFHSHFLVSLSLV